MAEGERSINDEASGTKPSLRSAREATDRPGVHLWTIALMLGLTLSLGVSPALRGMNVGLEPWIDRSDQLAGFVSQTAAVFGSILIVRLLLALRTRRPWIVAGLAGLLALIPLLVLLSAMRGSPNSTVLLVTTAAVAFMSALVAIARATVELKSALLPGVLTLSLVARLSFYFQQKPGLAVVVGWVALSASLLCCLLALQRKRGPEPAIALSAPFVSSDFLTRVLRGSLDPVFTNHLGNIAFAPVLLWLFLPAVIVVHFRDRTRRGMSAPLLVFCSLSPLTPLSLLAATVGLLGLLPETSDHTEPALGARPKRP